MKEQKTTAKRQKMITICVASLIAMSLLFHLFTFQVRVTEVAVVTTFGKPGDSIIGKTHPGLYWKLPYPIQDYLVFDARVQVFSGRMEQTFTSDGKNVIIDTFVGWRIHDPGKFLSGAGSIEEAQKKLEALIRGYTNGVLASYPFSSFVSERKEDLRFDEIEKKITGLLNKGEKKQDEEGNLVEIHGIQESLGITIEMFGIKRLGLPESTTREVFARMKEERNRIVENFRSLGEAKANEIKAEADAQKKKILIEAMAEAKKIRGEGDAESAKYYQIFDENRELALWLRKLDALEKLLSDNKRITLVLDTKTSPFDLLREEGGFPVKPGPGEPDDAQKKGGPKAKADKKSPQEIEVPQDKEKRPETTPTVPKEGQEKPQGSTPAQEKPKDEKAPEKPKDEKAPEKPKDEKAPEKPKDEKAPENSSPPSEEKDEKKAEGSLPEPEKPEMQQKEEEKENGGEHGGR